MMGTQPTHKAEDEWKDFSIYVQKSTETANTLIEKLIDTLNQAPPKNRKDYQ